MDIPLAPRKLMRVFGPGGSLQMKMDAVLDAGLMPASLEEISYFQASGDLAADKGYWSGTLEIPGEDSRLALPWELRNLSHVFDNDGRLWYADPLGYVSGRGGPGGVILGVIDGSGRLVGVAPEAQESKPDRTDRLIAHIDAYLGAGR